VVWNASISEEVQSAFYRAVILLLGVSLIFMGTLLLALGSLRAGETKGGFVIIGPFFFAYGEEIQPWVVLALLLIAVVMMAVFLIAVKKVLMFPIEPTGASS